MHDWLFNKVAEAYALSSDWDNRWRTGGTLDEVIEEAHLSPHWVLEEIERFVSARAERLDQLQVELNAAQRQINEGRTKAIPKKEQPRLPGIPVTAAMFFGTPGTFPTRH
jgi:hypothetical protein